MGRVDRLLRGLILVLLSSLIIGVCLLVQAFTWMGYLEYWVPRLSRLLGGG